MALRRCQRVAYLNLFFCRSFFARRFPSLLLAVHVNTPKRRHPTKKLAAPFFFYVARTVVRIVWLYNIKLGGNVQFKRFRCSSYGSRNAISWMFSLLHVPRSFCRKTKWAKCRIFDVEIRVLRVSNFNSLVWTWVLFLIGKTIFMPCILCITRRISLNYCNNYKNNEK